MCSLPDGLHSRGLGEEDTAALQTIGIDWDEVRRRAEEVFGEGALDVPPGDDETGARRFWLLRRRNRKPQRAPWHLPFTPRAKKALELSLREAIALKDRHIGTEHIVLGVLRSDDKLTTGLFERLGLEQGEVRAEVLADRRKAA